MTAQHFDNRTASDQAMSLVGYILLAWGQLEVQISLGIQNLTPEESREKLVSKDIARGLKDLLSAWRSAHALQSGKNSKHLSKVDAIRNEIQRVGNIRNLLAHGMTAMLIPGENSIAAIVCAEKYHENRMILGQTRQVFFEYHELGVCLSDIKKIEWAVGSINQDILANNA